MIELSLFDQIFYKFEQGGMSPVYMAGANIFEPPGSRRGLNGRILSAHLASRLEKIPLLRKKLVQDPMRIGNMRLVDDAQFDVGRHITCATLRKPGRYRELTGYLGEFSARRLDLSRPPWQFEIIEGLEGGRFALAYHLHHSLFDGVGAVSMMRTVHDTEPVAPGHPGNEPWQPEPEPTRRELLRLAVKENVNRAFFKVPATVAKTARIAGRTLPSKLAAAFRTNANDTVKLPRVQKTSLNVDRLSDRRVIAYAEFPLAEVKALSRRHDCSVNDLALLLNSCALEHYFEQIGEAIDFDLVAAMPVNMRRPDDTKRGNRLSVSRVSLHNRIGNLQERLRAIAHDTAVIKRGYRQLPDAELFSEFEEMGDAFSPIILDAMVYLAVRFNLMAKTPVMNVLVTNVPGPADPLYFAGARQVSGVPMAPAADGMGLSITVSSTNELLLMGYHGCPGAIKDKELFVEGVHKGFAALSAEGRRTRQTGRAGGGGRRAAAKRGRQRRPSTA